MENGIFFDIFSYIQRRSSQILPPCVKNSRKASLYRGKAIDKTAFFYYNIVLISMLYIKQKGGFLWTQSKTSFPPCPL